MRSLIKTLSLFVVAYFLIGGLEGAPGKPKLRYNKAPLIQVLGDYSDLTGKTILQAAAGLPTLTIDFDPQDGLEESDYIEAIESLLSLNKLSIIPLGEKFVVLVPDAEAVKNPPQFIDLTDSTKQKLLPEAGRYVSVTVKLKHVLPSELIDVLRPFSKLDRDAVLAVDASRTIVLRDYSANVNRMLDVIQKVDVPAETTEEFAIIPIKYALAADIATVISGLTNNQQNFSSQSGQRLSGSGSRTGGAGSGLGGSRSSTMSPRTFGGSSSSRGSTSSSRGSVFTNPAAAAAARERGQQVGGPFLGDTQILPYERNNAVLVIAENEQKMGMVRNLISELDKVQQQVLIEAIIMDVALDDNLSYGMSVKKRGATPADNQGDNTDNNALGMKHGGNFFGTEESSINSLAGAGLNYWGFLGNSWEVAVNAVKSDTRVNMLSRPRIMTSHAEVATLFIGETHPYVNSAVTDVTGGVREQYTEKQIGISMSILPFINPDGLVVMDIEQTVGDIISNKIIGEAEVPVTTDRTTTAKIAVRDGGVVLLGGFIKTKNTESKSGVPILKDIPILGALFRDNTDNNERQELVVLMRPTVLPTPEAAEAEWKSTRNGLPAVRGAELKERSMELKLNKDLLEKEKLMEKQEQKRLNRPIGIDPRLPRSLDQLEGGVQP